MYLADIIKVVRGKVEWQSWGESRVNPTNGVAAPADKSLTLLGEIKSVVVLSVLVEKAIDLLVCRRLKLRGRN